MKPYYKFPEIKDDFSYVNDEFTLFVVDQKFSTHRGREYLNQFIGSKHWISNDQQINSILKSMSLYTSNKIPVIGDHIKSISEIKTLSSIVLIDTMVSLTKLYGTTLHRITEQNIIDPLIIEEGNVSNKNIAHIVSLYKESNYRPTIIIILKKDNFNGLKDFLSKCPNNTNIKIIKNSTETTISKVINDGANNIDEFLECYSKQCFSTCSKTSQNVILSESWANNTVIDAFSPMVFKIRSTFLNEHKLDAVNDVKLLDEQLSSFSPKSINNQKLWESFVCMNKLFKVYCYDFGGKELEDARKIALDLDSEILQAHVYRYSHFLDCSRKEKQDLLLKSENIFNNYNISDHAVYCCNNRLIHQFSEESIKLNQFRLLKNRAKEDTSGLALMAHIINNVGVAYMFEMFLPEAIETFEDGLKYAQNNHIQQLALKSNSICAKSIYQTEVDEIEIRNILNKIYAPSLGFKRLPFLTAQFALNVLSAAVRTSPLMYKSLLHEYKIIELIQTAFDTNIMGTGSMIKQLEVLSIRYPVFDLLDRLKLPQKRTDISGIRLDFICKHGFNPFFFNTWL